MKKLVPPVLALISFAGTQMFIQVAVPQNGEPPPVEPCGNRPSNDPPCAIKDPSSCRALDECPSRLGKEIEKFQKGNCCREVNINGVWHCEEITGYWICCESYTDPPTRMWKQRCTTSGFSSRRRCNINTGYCYNVSP